jgi:hypothetical protein
MRITWRWVLPVVPLLFLYVTWHAERRREHFLRGLDMYHTTQGEGFRGITLWASQEAYQQHVRAENERKRVIAQSREPQVGWPDDLHYSYPRRMDLAFYLNAPGVLVGGMCSVILLRRFDNPMMPTFYLLTALCSFVFWYSIGDWIERRWSRQ